MNKRKILTLLTALTMSLTSMAFTPAYAVAEDITAAVASEENSGIYFNVKNDCISVELGLNTAVSISGYDDGKQYDVGESPIKFTVDDESVAKVTQVQGRLVNIKGVSMGETVLRAETTDGQKASVRVAIIEIPPVLTSAARTNITTTTVTATQTTTSTSTTTVIYDYMPKVEFDKSDMRVGEIREGRFCNPETKKTENGWVKARTDNISVDYTEGSDIFTVRALEAGRAEFSCGAKGCAFNAYVSFNVTEDEVLPDFAPMVEFDTSEMKIGETRKGRFYNPISGRSTGGSIKASDNVLVTWDDNGNFDVMAIKAGSVSLEITDNGCPFVAHVSLNVKPAESVTTNTTVPLTTITNITTTTAHIDYMTKVQFDNSPMNVGERRLISFFHPNGETEGGSVSSSSDLIEVYYENGLNNFEVKAVKEGEASILVHARGCAFDPTVTIKVVSASKLKGDANCDNGTDMADVVYVMQTLANPDKYKLSAYGKENADLNGDGVTVGDAQKIQLKLLGLEENNTPTTPTTQPVGVDTTDEAIKLIRSYDLNDYNVNARETMKQMFESFKKDGFIYRFAEVTGDDAVKLRDDYVNPPVWLGPYANFEDIGILYHVKAYDMNYQLYYFNRGNDYAGQSMAGYIKNRFGFNVTKVIDDKYFIFDSSKDGQNDISVIFALDDGHYCKVRCFGTEAELMKLAKSLKSVKLPLGEKKITDLNDVNALLIAYETEHKLPVSMITSISQGDKQVYVYLGTFDIKEQEKVIAQMKNYMKFMNIDEELVCFAIPQTIAE